MPARLITKCPECERITADCIDSSLSKDRTEYDGKRCHRCVVHSRKSKNGKPHAMNCGTGNSMFTGKKRQAVATWMHGMVCHY